MGRRNLAVPVKLWALACTIIGISLTTDTLLTCVLTVAGFIYLGVQRNWRFLRSMAAFYAALGILLYLIRFHDFHPAVARGAERPGKRGSYYGKRSDALDGICLALWTGATAVFLFAGGVRI